jgi:hypothetical protein
MTEVFNPTEHARLIGLGYHYEREAEVAIPSDRYRLPGETDHEVHIDPHGVVYVLAFAFTKTISAEIEKARLDARAANAKTPKRSMDTRRH